MAVHRRLGGLPLAVYVAALVLIPLAGVGMLGAREIGQNNEASATARRLATTMEAQVATLRVIAPLQAEELQLLEAVAERSPTAVDETAPPALAPSGRDAVPTHIAEALDRLQASLERLDPELGVSLAEMSRIRRIVEAEYGRAAVGEASLDTIGWSFQVTFDHLQQLSGDLGHAIAEAETGSPAAAALAVDLAHVAAVVTSAQRHAAVVADVVFQGPAGVGVADDEVLRAAVRHEDALAVATGHATMNTAELAASSERLPMMSLADITTAEAASTDVVGDAFVAYLADVDGFVSTTGGEVADAADRWASDIALRNGTAILVFVVVGLASLLFGLVVIRSFAHPLTRLRLQATRIGRGELSAEPLPVEGPSDVRKVTRAVNDMAQTLSLVDRHMHALAMADLDVSDDRLAELSELPGDVGASMRTSVERVTELTSRLKASEARLAQEARVDNLTSLPNRFAVLEYLDRSLRRSVERPSDSLGGPTTGVMFVDVDGFKSVNDTHGHAVGDVVLREIAQRLRGAVRDHDYVARLGGDEFLIVTDDLGDAERLIAFGERIIREIEQPYTIGDQLFAVSASVGVTALEAHDDAMIAIQRADAAVYQAKRRGRRRVEVFDQELQRSIEAQAELELALRQAIQHGELRMYLQPIADMSTGAAAGAEALVRWERPGVGLVPPADFIPIAERSGLIFDLERWVIEAACLRVAEWRLRGIGQGMRLAVNISGRHLIEGDLLADLDDAIAATGADPELLEIELTESQLLDDVGRASSVLAAVRDRGITVAIDDFGTGYSSMTYLQKLPVDVVKIDRSFIGSATANEFDSTIVESVVTISNALGLEIVAEGIETFDQLSYAMDAGVTYGQGFLFARPQPAEQAEALMFGTRLFDAERVRAENASRAWASLGRLGPPLRSG